jgi:hypothetical protein
MVLQNLHVMGYWRLAAIREAVIAPGRVFGANIALEINDAQSWHGFR